ncbi:MAG TPA: RDD family protein [Pyrinomonadaceae bacterium]|nr:RDD family protein [Pyrinomonadaceae bacterium]
MIHDTVREELETKTRKGEAAVANSGNLAHPHTGATRHNNSGSLPQPKLPMLDATPAVEQKPAVQRPVARKIPNPVTTPMPPDLQVQATAPPHPKSQQLKTPAPQQTPPAPPAPNPLATRFQTSELANKKTSKTLVEFQNKKATMPEWRLQLQSSVRQKAGSNRRIDAGVTQPAQKTTSGANALKVEFVEEEQPRHENPRVANALKRIEESRSKFTNQRVPEQPVNIGKAVPASRSYPFNVVAKSNEPPPPPARHKATVNASPKPMLVSPLKIEKKKGYDTNKLPPLQKDGKVSKSVEIPAEPGEITETTRERWENLDVDQQTVIETEVLDLAETDEIEDLAPLSMRFNGGLFDLIIGVFASLLVLSPFMLSGGTWMSVSGFLAIGATIAIVMFLYLTISLAFVGRTVGMRLFSLELVDVDENAYPTLHQAAVSSAVYMLSLAFAGVGFLPIFFNEERRAAHDILSGTILIREI